MRHSLADEEGLTLIELLLVTVLGTVIFIAGTNILIASVRGESQASDRAAAVQEARVMIEGVTREVREGYGVEVADSNSLTLLTYVRKASCGGAPASESIACRVTYECQAGTCTRGESDPEGSGPGTPVEVVRGVASDAVFSYSPSASDPNYVGVELVMPAELEGEDAITLEDGVALRNTLLGV